MLTYDIYENVENVIYSIDNVRLQFNINDYDHFTAELNSIMENCEGSEIKCRYYHTVKHFSFENLYTFKNDKGLSFTIAFSRSGTHAFNFDGFLDFNPNKISKWDFFLFFSDKFYQYATDINLKRYDLAIDIPFDRDIVKLIKDRRSYHYLKDRSITEYLGKRNNHNFLKVYDKSYESKLDYPLTRIEITAETDQSIIFPDIRLKRMKSGISISDLNVTDKVIFELLQQVDDPFEYIQKLSPRKRAMFKELMKSDYDSLDYQPVVTYKLIDKVNEKYVKGNFDRTNDYGLEVIPDIELPWEKIGE